MTREEKILFNINKEKPGVEIGPSYNPIAAKRNGYNVHVIDHMSKEGLIEKYRSHGVDVSRIEEVDFVWDGRSYSDLTGKKNYYSWIIASHVIEHTPDFVGFLRQCEELLDEDGVLSLAVPDSRFCFDHFRFLSNIGEIVDAFQHQRTIQPPGKVFDHFANVVTRNGQITWRGHEMNSYKCIHDRGYAKAVADLVRSDSRYVDVHSWIFTPTSFRLIIDDLNYLGLINLRELIFFPTEGHEFYMILSRTGMTSNEDRIELLKRIKNELSDA